MSNFIKKVDDKSIRNFTNELVEILNGGTTNGFSTKNIPGVNGELPIKVDPTGYSNCCSLYTYREGISKDDLDDGEFILTDNKTVEIGTPDDVTHIKINCSKMNYKDKNSGNINKLDIPNFGNMSQEEIFGAMKEIFKLAHACANYLSLTMIADEEIANRLANSTDNKVQIPVYGALLADALSATPSSQSVMMKRDILSRYQLNRDASAALGDLNEIKNKAYINRVLFCKALEEKILTCDRIVKLFTDKGYAPTSVIKSNPNLPTAKIMRDAPSLFAVNSKNNESSKVNMKTIIGG